MGISSFKSGFTKVTAGVGRATATASTGSPTIDTSTRAGKTIYKFTGSGSITIGEAGLCEVLVVGGGGGGASGQSGGGAGGAGGVNYNTSAYVPAGTLTVTIGAGGIGGPSSYEQDYAARNGYSSNFGDWIAIGGGPGANSPYGAVNVLGASNGGSGVGYLTAQTVTLISGQQGNLGGKGADNNNTTATGGKGGAGGGAGAAGADGVVGNSSTPGAQGGIGRQLSITGTATYYGGGGSGAGSYNTPRAGGLGGGGTGGCQVAPYGGSGGANTGGGGGGAGYAGNYYGGGGTGGSGYVVVVIG